MLFIIINIINKRESNFKLIIINNSVNSEFSYFKSERESSIITLKQVRYGVSSLIILHKFLIFSFLEEYIFFGKFFRLYIN